MVIAGAASDPSGVHFTEIKSRRGPTSQRNARVENELVPSQTWFGIRSEGHVHTAVALITISVSVSGSICASICTYVAIFVCLELTHSGTHTHTQFCSRSCSSLVVDNDVSWGFWLRHGRSWCECDCVAAVASCFGVGNVLLCWLDQVTEGHVCLLAWDTEPPPGPRPPASVQVRPRPSTSSPSASTNAVGAIFSWKTWKMSCIAVNFISIFILKIIFIRLPFRFGIGPFHYRRPFPPLKGRISSGIQ